MSMSWSQPTRKRTGVCPPLWPFTSSYICLLVARFPLSALSYSFGIAPLKATLWFAEALYHCPISPGGLPFAQLLASVRGEDSHAIAEPVLCSEEFSGNDSYFM